MSDTKNVQSTNISSKIRSSLVLKLNVKMLGRLLSGFLALNGFILILSIFVVFWKAEEGAQGIIKTLELSTSNTQKTYHNVGNYQFFKIEEPSKGLALPNIVQKYLPIEIPDAKRSISVNKASIDMKLLEKLDLVKYNIWIPTNGSSYHIVYTLGSDLRLLFYLSINVLIIEFLIIIGDIGKGARAIRKTLKPLSELAETAKNLNAKVLSIDTKTNGTDIKDLAGVISSIDANKLDRRISVNSSQDELKDLAFAINDMLNRINDSYQSQVRFVSDASHELRTPISVIQGYVNLLDRWGKKDEKTMQESIDAIKGETENMKDLVEQLLFLARGDNETIQLQKEDFDACAVVDEIIRETQMIDPNHNYETDLKGPAYINADKQLIKQAIRILVDNSIKYTPTGEKIILRVAVEDESVRIIVQDSGIGIEPENLASIFDRFYRSDESRARKTGGSGLGLSIAKWIIERHGAYFETLSRVNIGTRISIVIPVSKITSSELPTV